MSQPPGSSYPIRPFTPTSRAREVEERIREYITGNDLSAGARLPGEEWFAEQLQVGRPLIREAMKGLEAVGLIETRRGVGRFVSSFDPDAYLRTYTTEMLLQSFSEEEINETRCLLEISMAADATSRLTDGDLETICNLWEEIQASATQGQANATADLGLHRTIMQRADNRLIVAMLDAVYALTVRRYGDGHHTHDHDRLQQDLAEHAAIVEAALARDGRAVRRALVNHFRTTATRLGIDQRWRDVFTQEPVT